MKELSFIGRVDPNSRTAHPIGCGPCEVRISDDEPAYLYWDDFGIELILMCKACHDDPARAKRLIEQDNTEG